MLASTGSASPTRGPLGTLDLIASAALRGDSGALLARVDRRRVTRSVVGELHLAVAARALTVPAASVEAVGARMMRDLLALPGDAMLHRALAPGTHFARYGVPRIAAGTARIPTVWARASGPRLDTLEVVLEDHTGQWQLVGVTGLRAVLR